MEPVRGKIFGKAFSFSMSEMYCTQGHIGEELNRRKAAAYAEMLWRANIDINDFFAVEEGSEWEAFL